TRESLATPKPRKSRLLLRWSPTGRLFNQEGKIVDSSKSNSHSDCVNGGNLKLLINFVWKFMGTVRFGNDHVAAILGFGDLQWGNILIARVYFVEGLGHNLFSAGQFYDSDLEVAFRRNACFVRNLEGVDLLKGDPSSTKSWLWHQRLSHLNPFDTINDLARNDLVSGLPKFKYHKEHLCPSCEQGKSKRASHLPKPVPNLRQILHLLHMDLYGPMRIASINGKRKTPYELINGRKPDILFLHVFNALCYPKNDREDTGKLGAKATGRTVSPAQEPQVRQTSTASTTIADTAPTPTNSSSLATNIPITSQDVDELNSNAMVDGNTFFNPFANSSTSAAASLSSQNVDPSNMHTFYQPYPHEFQWTKEHPLEQVIGEPSRPVLTRNQLRSDESFAPVAMMEAIRIFLAYYAPKSFTVFQMNVKTAFLHGSLKEDVKIKKRAVFIISPKIKEKANSAYVLKMYGWGLVL
nr:retrovirus-related Pol polyprotein from transposon TNT 1-94 [Tanacetum cinerariifolium]